MKAIPVILSLLALISTNKTMAQEEDLLSMVEDKKPKKEYIRNAFKSTRVINGHSIEFLAPGSLDLRILHRFGPLNDGLKELFGLDQASMRLGFDYGIRSNLMAGVGRSTFKKELDGYLKYAVIRQSTGPGSSPLTLALVSGITLNTLPWQYPDRKNYFTSRLSYYFQGIIGRKFSEAFSLQISPTMVHSNLVAKAGQSNDLYSVGVGGRMKLSKRVAFTLDYFYLVNPANPEITKNPLSAGFDIETGGHVFQLHFSNSAGMNERAFLQETTSEFFKGDIRFGFNLSRVFQIRHG